jgi:hypothetical protein
MNTIRPWKTISVVPLSGTWANRYRQTNGTGKMILDPCPAILVQERGGETRTAFATYHHGLLFAACDTPGYEENSCAGGPRATPYRPDKPPWECLDESDPMQKIADEAGEPIAKSFVFGPRIEGNTD